MLPGQNKSCIKMQTPSVCTCIPLFVYVNYVHMPVCHFYTKAIIVFFCWSIKQPTSPELPRQERKPMNFYFISRMYFPAVIIFFWYEGIELQLATIKTVRIEYINSQNVHPTNLVSVCYNYIFIPKQPTQFFGGNKFS